MKIQKRTKKISPAIIVAIAGCILAASYFSFAYIRHDLWPFTEPTAENTNTELPKVKTDKDTPNTTPSTEDDADTSSGEPTKTEGKTPTQYEGEGVNDTPEYNNEQFRIPEESQ